MLTYTVVEIPFDFSSIFLSETVSRESIREIMLRNQEIAPNKTKTLLGTTVLDELTREATLRTQEIELNIREMVQDEINEQSVALYDIKKTFEEIQDECGKKNWDGYGAEEIKSIECTNSINFFECLLFQDNLKLSILKEVDIVPVNNGSISFEWFKDHQNKVLLLLNKEKNKMICTYTAQGQFQNRFSVSLKGKDNKELINVLNKIYG